MVMGYITKIHWHQILLIQMKKTHWGWREREREREKERKRERDMKSTPMVIK